MHFWKKEKEKKRLIKRRMYDQENLYITKITNLPYSFFPLTTNPLTMLLTYSSILLTTILYLTYHLSSFFMMILLFTLLMCLLMMYSSILLMTIHPLIDIFVDVFIGNLVLRMFSILRLSIWTVFSRKFSFLSHISSPSNLGSISLLT